MALVAPLAHVVIEEGQDEQFRRVDLGQDPSKTLATRARLDEPFQIPNREERVLVDGVLVVEVADDAARDGLELGKHLPEETVVVHLGEPRVEAGPRPQETQQGIAVGVGRKEVLGPETAGMLLHARQHLVRHRAATIQGGLKRCQPCFGPLGRRAHIQEPHAIDATHEVGPDRLGGRFQGPAQRSVDGARMPEVVSHQPLDAPARGRPRIVQAFRRPLLQFVAEDVVVAFRFQVKDGSHPQQELLGILERPESRTSLAEERRVRQLRNRLGAEQITKPAGRILQIGFELVERVVEACVTIGDQALKAPSVRFAVRVVSTAPTN